MSFERSAGESRKRHRELRLTTTGGVVAGHLAQVGVVLDCGSSVSSSSGSLDGSPPSRRGERTLGAEELAGDVKSLAADDNNLLATQQLLGNNAGQAAEKVALAINDDL